MFREQLEIGQLGESLIAQWLQKRGWHVLPAYEKEIDTGKGPRLFAATASGGGRLISPDLLIMKGGIFQWIEAKHKTRFSWYGLGKHFVTGVDIRHFAVICKVADITGLPVWLLFLHKESQTWSSDVERWNAPSVCPTGLLGQDISILRLKQSHRSDKYGKSGMIYWQPFEHLRFIAEFQEIF
jgi:hypothetical protein